ncbi:hypothetical protein EYF80_045011 [Liparis tanakae]|uniref:Uncharacterized protein n=1 Tax=Liparis tanakae TaxID=230148 RepID=A0A4Z2FWQ6_9TELE|nr:hypothetical protein EYF80_045011 [Liparis tanakae]
MISVFYDLIPEETRTQRDQDPKRPGPEETRTRRDQDPKRLGTEETRTRRDQAFRLSPASCPSCSALHGDASRGQKVKECHGSPGAGGTSNIGRFSFSFPCFCTS